MSKKTLAITGCSLLAAALLGTATPAIAAGSTTTHPAAVTAASQPAGSFEPVPATTVVDTRKGLGAAKAKVAPASTVTFDATTAKPVPADPVQAAVIEVTVPSNAPSGSLSVFPGGTAWDGRASLSLIGGGNIQQQFTVPLGSGGTISIRSNATAATDLIVEVLGYYVAGTATEPGMYVPSTARIVDSRSGHGLTRSVPANTRVTVNLAGGAALPNGANALIANIAVLNAKSSGHLGLLDGTSRYVTGPIRFTAGTGTSQTERTLSFGTNGTLTFANFSNSPIDVVLDLAGYFTAGTVTGEGGYVSMGLYPIRNGQVIQLPGIAPLAVGLTGLPVSGVSAAEFQLLPVQPGQSSYLGIQAAGPRHPTVTLSSSRLLDPTEYTTIPFPGNYIAVNSLSGTAVNIYGYVTGYYLKASTSAGN